MDIIGAVFEYYSAVNNLSKVSYSTLEHEVIACSEEEVNKPCIVVHFTNEFPEVELMTFIRGYRVFNKIVKAK